MNIDLCNTYLRKRMCVYKYHMNLRHASIYAQWGQVSLDTDGAWEYASFMFASKGLRPLGR